MGIGMGIVRALVHHLVDEERWVPPLMAGLTIEQAQERVDSDQPLPADLLIHSWDLARAIGATEDLDPQLVSAVQVRTAPRVDGMASTGLFAAPVDVPDDADQQTRLLALFGRRA